MKNFDYTQFVKLGARNKSKIDRIKKIRIFKLIPSLRIKSIDGINEKVIRKLRENE